MFRPLRVIVSVYRLLLDRRRQALFVFLGLPYLRGIVAPYLFL
jgi:hypothetical protein